MASRKGISLSELKERAGAEIGVSKRFRADPRSVDLFAEITHDRQAIRVDEAAAAKGPFRGTIAHGFFSLSLLSAMFENAMRDIRGLGMGLNYGFNSVRFLAPVRTGKQMSGRFTLKSLTERNSGQWRLAHDVAVETEGEAKPALVAERLALCIVEPGRE
jgi:acyl dehydratase